jgi:hypothetical protein
MAHKYLEDRQLLVGGPELAAATASNMPSPSATASPWRAGRRGQR